MITLHEQEYSGDSELVDMRQNSQSSNNESHSTFNHNPSYVPPNHEAYEVNADPLINPLQADRGVSSYNTSESYNNLDSETPNPPQRRSSTHRQSQERLM